MTLYRLVVLLVVAGCSAPMEPAPSPSELLVAPSDAGAATGRDDAGCWIIRVPQPTCTNFDGGPSTCCFDGVCWRVPVPSPICAQVGPDDEFRCCP